LEENYSLTFSIVALDSETKALGVAVSTAVPAVGSVVPHVEAGVGAIATQAQANVLYGIEGLKLLKGGLSPQNALEKMLRMDPEREKRQVIIIDIHGRTAAFTGRENVEWKGHIVGKDCAAAGNILIGSSGLKAMIETFEVTRGKLAERLLRALEAGQEAGGDKRGRMSAALLVAGEQWISETRPVLNLRVDAHQDPVAELRRIYAISRSYFEISE
jgi:uncharacterized Ntn-hydrolase superfamily protein